MFMMVTARDCMPQFIEGGYESNGKADVLDRSKRLCQMGSETMMKSGSMALQRGFIRTEDGS